MARNGAARVAPDGASLGALMLAHFDRFTVHMTLKQAQSAAHPGQCDADVLALSKLPVIARQLRLLRPKDVSAELRGYGAWDAQELADHSQNLQRILWIAAGNITEDQHGKKS